MHGSTTDQYLKKHLGGVIIAVDGRNITKSDDIINYIGQHKIAGDNITFTVYRNGHAIDLKATLAARPSLFPLLTIRSAPPLIPHPPMRYLYGRPQPGPNWEFHLVDERVIKNTKIRNTEQWSGQNIFLDILINYALHICLIKLPDTIYLQDSVGVEIE